MRWRILTSVTLLIITFVFAVQPVAACHPVVDGDCDDIWVDVVGESGGNLTVSVDGNQIYSGSAHDGDHFQWSLEELNLEPCWTHEVEAKYGGVTDTTNVGGLACCNARLNLSNIDCLEPLCEGVSNNIWTHFVMVHKPDGVKDWGQVDFSITIPGVGTTTGIATFDKVTGDTVHYNGYVTGGGGIYSLISGSVTITFNDNSPLTIDLANPGDTEVTNCECPPTPACSGVNADIDHNTMLITGTGNGLGDEWRVVKTADATVKDSDSGNTASFAFTGEYEVNYRLQFRWDGGNWSSSGCLFSFSQALAATSSVDCDEETGESTLTVCIQNISEDRTYFATVKVGNLEVSDFIGPDEQLCVDKTKQGGTLKWQVLIGGKLFAEGQEKLDSCTPFVPEWGTLALLGSGLTGLAGYARLRRRHYE